jgi:hypothetical protein
MKISPTLIISRVGQKLRFFTGTIENAPSVMFGEEEQPQADRPENLPQGFQEVEMNQVSTEEGEEETTVSIAKKSNPRLKIQGTNPQGLYPGAPRIPPPQNFVKPVLRQMPSLFANSQSYDATQYNDQGMSFDLRPPVRVNPLYVASSFLYSRRAKDYPAVGYLLEAESNERLVGLNHKVYIRSQEKLSPGERFTVMGLHYPFDRNQIQGDVIQYQGSVEITEVLPNNIYRGLIVKSIAGIKGEPWITREKIPAFGDDFSGRPNSKAFRIVGGGNDNETQMYGQSDIIFISGGSNQGVRVGDVMGIYKRRDMRYQNVHVDRAPLPIGHLKIFRAEPNISSAFILNSDDVIIPGDETGTPTIIEQVVTDSERGDLDQIETGLDFDADAASQESSEDIGEEFTELDLDEDLSEDSPKGALPIDEFENEEVFEDDDDELDVELM